MIHYMPFTSIGADAAAALTRSVGPLSISAPLQGQRTADLQPLIQNKLLALHCPKDLDRDGLERICRDFKQWAELHKPGVDDLTALYRSFGRSIPMLEETAPSLLSTHVRRIQKTVQPESVDRLVQSALFLVMASDYDAHQESLERGFAALRETERGMYADLTGDAQDADSELPAPDEAGFGTAAEDRGAYMTLDRIISWAEFARSDAAGMMAWVTTSRAVMEQLEERLPGLIRLGSHPVASEGSADQVRACVQALACSRQPENAGTGDLPKTPHPAVHGGRITWHLLAGVSPPATLQRLSRTGDPVDIPPGDALNTVILFFEQT